MAKLSSGQRKAMPKAEFAGPGKSYPVNDANHARNALARASQMEKAGKLSPSAASKIRAKAHKKLGK